MACALLSVLEAPGAWALPSDYATGTRQAGIITIPFDPPLGRAMRYRLERVTERAGQRTQIGHVVSLEFARHGDAYTVEVTPEPQSVPSVAGLAGAEQVAELISRPYKLLVSNDGQITGMVDQQSYWDAVAAAYRAMGTGAAAPAQAGEAAERVIGMFRDMPPASRLAVLTASIQPLLEFAGVELAVGETVTTTIPAASPFGGTINREARVTLTRASPEAAIFTSRIAIPGSELQAFARSLMERLSSATGQSAAELRQAIGSLRGFNHVTQAEHEVSRQDGMVRRHRSTEVIEVGEGAQRQTRTTIRTMQHIGQR